MPPERTCEECGAELPANAPEGLCPRCLLRMPLAAAAENPTATVLLTEKPGDRIGRYKLLQQIGEGGCGVVYMAEQEEPVRRRVALKVIKLGMDTRSVIARFEAERQALALMDHPNIAKVLDAGATDAGRPFFVMELVRGIKITDYCDQNNLLTRERLELFIQVCHAIQHAHQKGIIHRDIKPSNVLVTLNDGVPMPKVIDFGIAKATQQPLTDKTLFTAFAQFIGTPAYMSPEQAEMNATGIDTRSDIYSLGVLLYELLTSQTPFDAKDHVQAGLDEIRRVIREEEPVRPSTRLSTMLAGELTITARHRHIEPLKLIHLLRGDLDWIVMKALEKDRTRRYETANGLATDVQRHLADEPVVACPPSNLYQFQKLVRRHRLAFTAASAVAASLLVGLGVSTWALLREKETRWLWSKEADRANQALALMRVQKAEELFAANETSTALAHLAQVLRQNSTNEIVAVRVFSNLVHHVIVIPLAEPLVHTGAVYQAQFSRDGRRVVTASSDGTARVWDVGTGRPLIPPLRHESSVLFVQFSPDGSRVATCSGDHTARVWNSETGQPLTQPLTHPEAVRWVYFSPDGQRLVTSTDSPDGAARIWNSRTGELLAGPITNVYRMRCQPFSRDGRYLVFHDGDHAWIRDGTTGAKMVGPLTHVGHVLSVEFSPDGSKVLTASTDGTTRVWEANTGKPLTQPLNHGKPLWVAHFSPDGQRVVTVCQDATVQIYDPNTGRALTGPLPFVKADRPVSTRKIYTRLNTKAARFSPDGKMVVMEIGETAQLLDATTGRALTEQLKQDAVISTDFSPDSQMIITASGDGTAQIWSIRRPLWTETFEGLTNQVSVVFAPAPDWVSRLLEALAGKRLNEQGVAEPTQPTALRELRRQLAASSESDVWTRWGKWLFAGCGQTNTFH